jgi:hypothetical protein
MSRITPVRWEPHGHANGHPMRAQRGGESNHAVHAQHRQQPDGARKIEPFQLATRAFDPIFNTDTPTIP